MPDSILNTGSRSRPERRREGIQNELRLVSRRRWQRELTSGKALGAKDLASSEVQKKSDAELTEVITKGKGKMPAFGAKLKPEEIKQLVAYIRAIPKK